MKAEPSRSGAATTRRRGWGAALLVLSAALPVAASSARAPVLYAIEHSTHEYVLDAEDWSALMSQVLSRRPREGEPRSSHGMTQIGLESRYQMEQRPAECRISGLEVRLDMRRTTPRWVPLLPVSDALQARWERARRALVEHEEGHEALAQRAAQRLVEALNGLPAVADCKRWQRAVQREQLRVLTWLQVRNENYDQRTRHGETQGARLSPHSEEPRRRCPDGESLARRRCRESTPAIMPAKLLTPTS